MTRSLLTVAAVSFFLHCAINPAVTGNGCGGGASETVNGFAIIVQDSTVSSPNLRNAMVFLYDRSIVPGYRDGFVDSFPVDSGSTQLSLTARSGTYNLLAKQRGSGLISFLTALDLSLGSSDTICGCFDSAESLAGTARVVPDTLKKDTIPANHAMIYVQGSFFYTFTDDSGKYQLDGIPRGVYAVSARMDGPVTFPPRNLAGTSLVVVPSQQTKEGVDIILTP